MTRADERYNDFLYALHQKGVYLSTWDENIDKQLWEDTAIECGIEHTLCWDTIDATEQTCWD